MQTNLKFNTLEFFTPIKKRRTSRFIHAIIGMRGPKSNSDTYYLYLDGLKQAENLSWKYVKVGHDGKDIYITEGDEFNGYYINTNGAISNKDLIENIYKLLNVEIPFVTGQSEKIVFVYKKVDNDIYLLKKI